MTKHEVIVYTDGACDPNPGPGGWGAVLRYGRHEREISGSDPQATNNRMELQAALAALRALKRPCRVILYTDSEYLRRGISEWLPDWQRRGWRTSSRQPVQNQDLWQALAAEIGRHQIEWRWVRGHAGDPLNERADRLARAAIPRAAAPATAADAVQLFPRASCRGVQGPGGWAVVVRRGDEVTSLSGTAAETTSNAMELQAAIEGLAALTQPRRVQLYSVSKYVYQGITRWLAGWRARGWQTRQGQPVRNKTLWLALEEAAAAHEVEWCQLPAGERPPESEQAATLAAQAARTASEASGLTETQE